MEDQVMNVVEATAEVAATATAKPFDKVNKFGWGFLGGILAAGAGAGIAYGVTKLVKSKKKKKADEAPKEQPKADETDDFAEVEE
jgi:hypothetical protein